MDNSIYTRPQKYSLVIAGHQTSITLEPAFMSALKEIAEQKNVALASLVSEVDAEKGDAGLSSALRVYVLNHYQTQTKGA